MLGINGLFLILCTSLGLFISIISNNPMITIIFFFIGILPLFFCIIIKKYRQKHPEKYYGGTIFKVKLYSITDDVIVDKGKSMESNIVINNYDKLKYCGSFLVQKTSNKNYVREIVSGILLPVCEIYEHQMYPASPVFIPYNFSNIDMPMYKENVFEVVKNDEILEYISEKKGKIIDNKSFAEYLQNIIDTGNKYYSSKLK